jgi:hypothetical protein
MADRNLNRPFCYQKMLTKLTGVVPIASGGAVGTKKGIGYSVSKTSAGLYTFVLDDQFYEVHGILCSLVQTTESALVIKPRIDYTTITTQKLGSFKLVILNSATPTDVGSASEIHFEVNLKNTSAPL